MGASDEAVKFGWAHKHFTLVLLDSTLLYHALDYIDLASELAYSWMSVVGRSQVWH